MPIPGFGNFNLFPERVGILSGNFAVTSVGTPPPITSAMVIGDYYATEISTPAVAPRMWEGFDNGGTFTLNIGDHELTTFLKHTINFDTAGTPTPIDWISADFPVGVRFYAFDLFIEGPLVYRGQNRRISQFEFKASGSIVYTLNPIANQTNVLVSNFTNYTPIINPGPFWGANKLFGTTIGFKNTVVSDVIGGPAANLTTNRFYILGAYQSNWISLSLNPANANPGDVVTITDALANLNRFSRLKAYWRPNRDSDDFVSADIDDSFISTRTNTTITLKLPTGIGLPYGGRIIHIMGVGDEAQNYFGEFDLARINASSLLTNGSGVYNLTPQKRNDTYYDRSVTPSVTTDLKIPNPYAKTGFI